LPFEHKDTKYKYDRNGIQAIVIGADHGLAAISMNLQVILVINLGKTVVTFC